MIQLGSAYGEIQIGTGEAEKSVKSLSQQMRDVGAGLSLAISTPLIGVAAAGLHAAAGFEESMNLIQTVGGATAEQMQNVQAQALQLGKDTSFSAGEAADGFLELTKAGFDVESSMGAIGGVLDLAAAGNLSVGSAAEIAANAINAFQLPASDAGRIANMLAAGANASSVEVTDLSDSLEMSGAVMGSYGQSLDDTVTALSLLGNAGLKGSDAGTSLKQMFISLAAPTDEARKLMGDLGISIYDAQGNMLAMPDILANLQQAMFGVSEATVEVGGRTAEQSAELKRLQGVYKRTQASINDYETGVKGASLSDEARQKKLTALRSEMAQQQTQIQALSGITGTATTVQRQLTEEQRNAALATIFGSDAVRSANILLQAGTDDWNEMSRAVNKGGAASEVAEARQKGLNGAMEYFKGTMESLLIEVLLPFLDTLSGGLRWIADLVALFTQLPQPVQYAALAFLAVLAAIGPVLLALSGVATVIGLLLSPIGLIGVAIAGLAAAWVGNWGDIQGKVQAVWDYVKPIFDNIVGWLQTTAGQALTFLQSKWNEAWPAIQSAVVTAWAMVEPIFISIRDWVATKISTGLTALQAAWNTAWPAIQTAVSTAWTTIHGIFVAIGGWLAIAIPVAVGFLGSVWSTVWGALQSAVSTAWGIIKPIFAFIRDWVQTHMPTSLPTFGEAWSALWGGIQASTQGAWLAIAPYLGSISAWVKTNLPNALPTLQTAWSNAWTAIRTAANGAWTVIEPYLQSAFDWAKTTLPEALPALQAAWSIAWTAMRTAVNQAWAEIAPKLAQIEAWMAKQYPAAVEKADQATGESLPAAAEKSNAFVEALRTGWGGLVEWFEPIIQRFVESFRHMIAGFSEMGASFQGVWDAIQPVIRYIEVAFAGLLLVLGTIVAGIVALFLNLASAIMNGVTPIVQGVVDLIAGVFESISVGWKGTVDLVGSLIAGDWTAAWAAAGEIVRATGMLFTAIWAGVWGVIYGILTIIGSFVKSVLEDMGVDVDANLQVISQLWDTTWNGALGLIKAIVASWIALWTTVRQWLVWTLPGAANTLKTKFETTWNAIKNFLLGAIAPIISAFETIRTFLTETLPNAANSFKGFLGNLHLPNPFSAIASAVSAIQSAIDAVIGRVQAFKDALSGISLPPWLGGASASGVSASSAVEPSGRSRFGGPALAAAGGITVNVTTGPISSQIDVTELAYEVARQIRIRL